MREQPGSGSAAAKIRAQLWPYKELMSYYRCAMMEVETKFRVLSEELSMQYDRNPIESIRSRLKSPESIVEKLVRRNLPLTEASPEPASDCGDPHFSS